MAYFVSSIGLFYCFATWLATRAIVQSLFIEKALDAINRFGQSAQAAPSCRFAKPIWGVIWWLGSYVLIGLGAVSAVMQWQGAVWFFVAAAISQGLYLLWLAPSYWDQDDDTQDPAHQEGRKQTTRAFYFYCVATIVVIVAAYQNELLQWSSIPTAMRWLGSAVALLGFAWFAKQLWPMRGSLVGTDESMDNENVGPNSVETTDQNEPEIKAMFIPEKIQVRLVQGRGFFFDAQSGVLIEDAFETLNLPFSVENMFEDWMSVWIQVHDARDPLRQRLIGNTSGTNVGDDDSIQLQQAADHAFAALIKYLDSRPMAGDKQTTLEPTQFALAAIDLPVLPSVEPQAVLVLLEFMSYPLWFAPPSVEVGGIAPDELGLSWGLCREIDQWALDFDESWNSEDPSLGSGWDSVEKMQANLVGEQLCEKIRIELEATNRSNVLVTYQAI